MQFFELFHHFPTLTSLKFSPSKIVKDNPSSAIILRINKKLNYCSTKVPWHKTEYPPKSKWLEGGQWSPRPAPSAWAPGATRSPRTTCLESGQHAKSWWWGEAGVAVWESRPKAWLCKELSRASKVLFLVPSRPKNYFSSYKNLICSLQIIWTDPW